ncbi:MAG: alcohol dehydrogenase catalytic domain-containing protein [Planctomycetota bacterium]
MKSVEYLGNREIAVGSSRVIAPSAGEVRLEVSHCGICGTDMHIFHGAMDQRVRLPQIIGHEVSAKVVEVGASVDRVCAGDRVAVRPLSFGEPTPFDKGYEHVGKNLQFIGIDLPGGMQTSWTVPDYTLHKLPSSLSLEHGAMIEPAAVACHDVRLARLQQGETCVVIGGGPIGLLIALVAKQKGANVVLSEVNEVRLELASDIGITCVNPATQDLSLAVQETSGGAMADCLFEVSGSSAGVNVMTELVNVRGRIVLVAIHPQSRPVDLFKFFWSELTLIGARLYEECDFDEAIHLATKGQLHLDRLITEVSPIEQAPEMFERIDANPNGIKYLIQCS